jgi:hypothetical protein
MSKCIFYSSKEVIKKHDDGSGGACLGKLGNQPCCEHATNPVLGVRWCGSSLKAQFLSPNDRNLSNCMSIPDLARHTVL